MIEGIGAGEDLALDQFPEVVVPSLSTYAEKARRVTESGLVTRDIVERHTAEVMSAPATERLGVLARHQREFDDLLGINGEVVDEDKKK